MAGWRVKDPGKKPQLFCPCAETLNQVSRVETVGSFSGNKESEALIQRGCYKGKKKLQNLLVLVSRD